jgi:hypothetical protein
MAQTIAMQRGTVSITANGTTATTLFTQSGGAATRVITGGMTGSWSTLVSSSTSFSFILTVTPSGASYDNTIGYMQGYTSGGNLYTFSLLPEAGATGSQATNSYNVAINPSSTLTTSYGGPFSDNIAYNNIYLNTSPAGASFNNNYLTYNAFPKQFWIGPSDVVRVKAFNYSGGTLYLTYSFVTVTES